MSSRSQQRLVGATAILLGAAVLATPCPAEQDPASTHASLERIVAGQLDEVRANVDGLCEPHCGEVLLEPSEETPAAESERIAPGASRISYSERFIADMLGTYGTSVVYTIVAHEYGHHLDEIPYGSSWTRELRADKLAGCALARRADPLGPTLRWMRHEHFEDTLHTVFDDPTEPEEVVREYTRTHPPWLDRITALMRGVALCGAGKGPVAVAEVLGGVGVDDYSPTPGEFLVLDEHRWTPMTRASLLPPPRPLWDGERVREAVYPSLAPPSSF
jgi:hypothetical protein